MSSAVDRAFNGPLIPQGGALQQVRTSYVTAVSVQKPRELEVVRKRLLEESLLAGEAFYYGWSAGQDRVEGPSIDLAMAAARCWGNCAVEALPVTETADSWIFTSAFVDVETGTTIMRSFRQSKKSVVAGKMDAERKDDVRFQIGQSKAHRNAVTKCLPKWLIDAAMDNAKLGVRKRLEKFIAEEGHAKAVDLLIKGLARCGVKEESILMKFEVAARTALEVDHLVILRGDLTALQNGQERPDALFPGINVAGPGGESKVKTSPLNETISPKRETPPQDSEPPFELGADEPQPHHDDATEGAQKATAKAKGKARTKSKLQVLKDRLMKALDDLDVDAADSCAYEIDNGDWQPQEKKELRELLQQVCKAIASKQ